MFELAALERSEPSHSGGAANSRRAAVPPVPDPEVVAKAQRRKFTAEYYYCVINAMRRKKDSEEAAESGSRQSVCVGWRWSVDYAVRTREGRPRGRKSCGSAGADNSSWPVRAEGEKRLLSATRNPYAAMQRVA